MGHAQTPPLEAIEQALQEIRFEPRPSLEAEVLWRVRREPDGLGQRTSMSTAAALVLGTVALALFVYLLWSGLLGVVGHP